eukprot:CAMPEP_0194537102 /NCGR_PEP_ID=MMETSP0253-20130528/76260_1 /TAXON_ID=2966 /ORGANISM="Noctiluca scintillans" /LENGTH=157 /DNA_ID=CAMNT_0039383089 /DNA_START=62 /DNA_END=535 /DNA_ORIENTATION=+
MMPQAGATRAILGVVPVHSPRKPSSRKIKAIVCHMPKAALPAVPRHPCFLEAGIQSNCDRVLTTSKGVVMKAATPPEVALDTKVKTGNCTDEPSQQPRCINASRIDSVPNQYSALKGTSRQSVLVRPRINTAGPSSRTILASIEPEPRARGPCSRRA